MRKKLIAEKTIQTLEDSFGPFRLSSQAKSIKPPATDHVIARFICCACAEAVPPLAFPSLAVAVLR